VDHVKGHQDDKVSYDELSLPAQLNVDADALATNALFYYPTPCKHIPLLPAAQVQLGSLLESFLLQPQTVCLHL
jgi:hypothetical protein